MRGGGGVSKGTARRLQRACLSSSQAVPTLQQKPNPGIFTTRTRQRISEQASKDYSITLQWTPYFTHANVLSSRLVGGLFGEALRLQTGSTSLSPPGPSRHGGGVRPRQGAAFEATWRYSMYRTRHNNENDTTQSSSCLG